MLKILKTWLCCAWMPLYFGGDSSSQANQTQTTETQDNRIAAAQDSVNLNNSRGSIGGNVTVVSTDHGAVNGALQFATNNSAITAGTVSQAFDFARSVQAGAASESAASLGAVQAASSDALNAVQAAYGNESKTLADAYTTAKAGEQKVMVAGVFALVAFAMVKVFGRAS